MNLDGDATGVAELKKMAAANKDFLKFLIKEVRTSFEGFAEFKGTDGVRYKLVRDGLNPDHLTVQKIG
ncbi:MAG: hypothetical protein KIT79_14100 [Deltaproteobacteria bacterium]|nr:hypothetical protein [Deltaproteobacteria bacterium]